MFLSIKVHIKSYINRKGILLFFFSVITSHAFSQNYNFRNFNSEDGLAQSYVYSIVQDMHGYLWVGTENGLSRYNGFIFENYTTKDSLSDNFIACGISDRECLWLGHMNGGISYFNGKKFHPVKMPQLNLSPITHFQKSPDGNIWSSTYSVGLQKISKETGVVKSYVFKDQIFIISFDFIDNTKLLIGSSTGLLNCKLKEPGEIEIIRPVAEIQESKVTCIQKMRNKSGFYIATENDGIFQLITEDSLFKVSKITAGTDFKLAGIQYLYEDSQTNLWLASFGNGLIKISNSTKREFTRIDYFNKVNGFVTNNIRTIFEDRDGNIWSGNYGEGLTQISPKTFSVYTFDEHLYGNNIFSICFDNLYKWIGTEIGLVKMDLVTDKIVKFYGKGSGLPKDTITSIYSPNGKELWIGTEKNGVFRMEVGNERILKYSLGDGALENSINIITGKGEQVWIGTKKGLCSINSLNNKIKWYSINQGGLPHNFINCLYIDRKNRLWISTRSNILSYILDEKVFKIPINPIGRIFTLGPITEDSDSRIWVGSHGNGVFMIEADSISNLTVKEGLISNFCYSLIGDDHKNIWVGHKGGLSKIRTTSFLVKPIQYFEGTKDSYQFNQNAAIKDQHGKIWFGSFKGLVSYNPSIEYPQLQPPGLVITSIKINDEEKDITNKIILSSGNYKIRIDFLGICLKDPALVTYHYTLEGYDQRSEITKNTSISYNHLTDGDYTFILKASSGDGVISENPLILNIIIKKPIWKKWWFYIIVFILLIIAVIIYIKRRDYIHLIEKRTLEAKVQERTFQLAQKNSLLNEKQKEIINQNNELEKYRNYLEDLVGERTKELLKAKNKAEESDRLKTAFLNNISHEIRTPLNAICGFTKLLDNDSLTKENRNKYIKIIDDNSKFLLFLINEILDISLIEADQIVLSNENFNIDDILNELEDYYKFNNNKNIEFEFINKLQNNGLQLYCDKKRFHQIFTHLLNNAFKFTESGQIKFGYEKFEKFIRFFISDTGIGFNNSEVGKIFNPFYKIENNSDKLYRGTGIGLAICKKLVEMMSGEIWVVSVVNKGSVFYFSLPVISEKLNSNEQEIKKEFEKNFLNNITILVVEDDPVNFELLNKILKSYGAIIKWVQNEKDAINFIIKDPSIKNCIILIDINMEFDDSNEVNKQIKAINAKIPIIALTEFMQIEDKQKVINENFDDYISLPIKTETLLTVLSKFL